MPWRSSFEAEESRNVGAISDAQCENSNPQKGAATLAALPSLQVTRLLTQRH